MIAQRKRQPGGGIGRLVQIPGALDEVLGEVDDDQAVRNDEHQTADEFDPLLAPPAQTLTHQVDAHVCVLEVGEADAEQEQDGVQVPLRLLQLCRTEHQEPPGHHVQDDDEHQRDRHPGAKPAEAVHDSPQELLDRQKPSHRQLPQLSELTKTAPESR